MSDKQEIKPGDFVTTYFKGFYRVVSLKDHYGNGDPIVTVVRIADSLGNISNGKKEYYCAASYCKIIDSQTEKQELIKRLEKLNKLENFIEEEKRKMVKP